MTYSIKALSFRVSTVVPFSFLTGGIIAAEPADHAVELPLMTVSAHDGVNIPRNSTGVSVDILEAEDQRKKGVNNIAEALSSIPGVTVLPEGGAVRRGNVANIAIRGMSSDSATLTMLDGMRLFNSGGSGLLTANTLARTDLFSVGEIEVIKGSQGATFGSGAMGGAICMNTPQGEVEPRLSLFQEVGNHGDYTSHVSSQGATEQLRYYLSAMYNRSDNDLRFVGGYSPTQRNAGEFEGTGEALRLDWQANKDNLITLTYRRDDSEYGYSGFMPDWYSSGIAESYYRYSFRNNLITTKWQSRLTDKWTSSLMVGYFGYDASLGSGYCQDLRNVQVEWTHAYRWCAHQSTTGGISWNRSTFGTISDGKDVATDNHLENSYAFFAEHIYSPVENWTSSLAARLELSNLYHPQTTLRAATSYRFHEDKGRLFASVGTGYRTPSAFQRSQNSSTIWGTTYRGNPSLNVEESVSADLGAEHDITEGHTFGVTGFWLQRKNAITTLYTAPAQATYENASDHWTITGVELFLRGHFDQDARFGYKLSWTYTCPETSNGSQIPWTTRQTWAAELYATPIEELTIGFGLAAATGRSNFEGYTPSRIDNFYTLRCYARYKVNEHLTLHLRVENLTDQKFVTEGNYAPDCALVSPGMSIYGGMTLEF